MRCVTYILIALCLAAMYRSRCGAIDERSLDEKSRIVVVELKNNGTRMEFRGPCSEQVFMFRIIDPNWKSAKDVLLKIPGERLTCQDFNGNAFLTIVPVLIEDTGEYASHRNNKEMEQEAFRRYNLIVIDPRCGIEVHNEHLIPARASRETVFCDITSLSSRTVVDVNITINVRNFLSATGHKTDLPGDVAHATSGISIDVLKTDQLECSAEFSIPRFTSTAAAVLIKVCSFGPLPDSKVSQEPEHRILIARLEDTLVMTFPSSCSSLSLSYSSRFHRESKEIQILKEGGHFSHINDKNSSMCNVTFSAQTSDSGEFRYEKENRTTHQLQLEIVYHVVVTGVQCIVYYGTSTVAETISSVRPCDFSMHDSSQYIIIVLIKDTTVQLQFMSRNNKIFCSTEYVAQKDWTWIVKVLEHFCDPLYSSRTGEYHTTAVYCQSYKSAVIVLVVLIFISIFLVLTKRKWHPLLLTLWQRMHGVNGEAVVLQMPPL